MALANATRHIRYIDGLQTHLNIGRLFACFAHLRNFATFFYEGSKTRAVNVHDVCTP